MAKWQATDYMCVLTVKGMKTVQCSVFSWSISTCIKATQTKQNVYNDDVYLTFMWGLDLMVFDVEAQVLRMVFFDVLNSQS